jgi:ribonuclease HI
MLNVYTDGACRGNPGDCGIGIIAKENGKTVFEISEYFGKGTNNVAEYSALLRGLEETIKAGYKTAHFVSDSELMVKQINGEYRVKDANLRTLCNRALALIAKMEDFSIKHVRREQNKHADFLANKGIDGVKLSVRNADR